MKLLKSKNPIIKKENNIILIIVDKSIKYFCIISFNKKNYKISKNYYS